MVEQDRQGLRRFRFLLKTRWRKGYDRRRHPRGTDAFPMALAIIALPMGIFGEQVDLLVEKGALKKKNLKLQTLKTLNPKP